jgi:hypothetical protein
MKFSTEWRDHSARYDQRRLSGNAVPQRIMGGAALGCMLLACAWILCANLAGIGARETGADQALETEPVSSIARSADATSVIVKTYRRPSVASAYAKLATALNASAGRVVALDGTVALFDSRWLGLRPGTFVKTAALQADSQSAARTANQLAMQSTPSSTSASSGNPGAQQSTPPQARPPMRTASLRDEVHASGAAAAAPAEQPTIFERLFGKASPLTLAYAAPDDGGLGAGQGGIAGRYDRSTAVYDISAHTVYMPDGTRLEAHSGLGSSLDDPRHADERMRGPTPPNVYDLVLREAPFHGVRALRLIPVDEDKVFGRSGLLAHTYMLGPNGQSNGCVSFRNYNAFLQAYMNHEIKRLVVVSRLD